MMTQKTTRRNLHHLRLPVPPVHPGPDLDRDPDRGQGPGEDRTRAPRDPGPGNRVNR